MFAKILSFKDLSFIIDGSVPYLIGAGLFIAIFVALKIFVVVIRHRVEKIAGKTKNKIDDVLLEVVLGIKTTLLTAISLYLALQFVPVPAILIQVALILVLSVAIYQGSEIIKIALHFYTNRGVSGNDKKATGAVELLGLIARIILWALGLLLILSNLGIDITSLIAGLGIGGIAVALALQNILGDLFSSFAIYFDKPFEVGDFIIVGDKSGVVKKIGIKTTRITSLQGEEVVFANKELTTAQIQNFKKLKERRKAFNVGVTYDTPAEIVEKIPSMVERVVKEVKGVRFDRAHFMEFADSALLFEVVYFVLSSEYNDYMDANQAIHLGIKKDFDEAKIEFAFPTQTLYVKKD